jgi:tRNA U38,U39,U40 pseudouridine synthase TruA
MYLGKIKQDKILLKFLKIKINPSRTDAGVHAFSNSIHIDLEINNEFFENKSSTDYLKDSLNRFFIKKNLLIR